MNPSLPRALAILLVLLWAGPSPAADVAVLRSVDAPAWKPALDGLRKGAPSHTLMDFDLKGQREEGERVIQALKGKNVILVALGNLAAQLGHELAPEAPLVFSMVQDPGKLGLLGAANTTGVAFTIPVKNQLAAFRMVNPRGVRIGVIFSTENVGRQVQDAQKAAGMVHLGLVERPVASEKEVPEALRSLLRGAEAVDALWLPPDALLLTDETRRFLLSETLKANKPVYTFSTSLVQEGALVSDGPDYTSIGEELAEIVNRLAAGEKPGKIEMLIPRAELVINKKIADRIRVEVPADALRQAAKVY